MSKERMFFKSGFCVLVFFPQNNFLLDVRLFQRLKHIILWFYYIRQATMFAKYWIAHIVWTGHKTFVEKHTTHCVYLIKYFNRKVNFTRKSKWIKHEIQWHSLSVCRNTFISSSQQATIYRILAPIQLYYFIKGILFLLHS